MTLKVSIRGRAQRTMDSQKCDQCRLPRNFREDVRMIRMVIECPYRRCVAIVCLPKDLPYPTGRDEIRVPAERFKHRTMEIRRLVVSMKKEYSGFTHQMETFVKNVTGNTTEEIIEEEMRMEAERESNGEASPFPWEMDVPIQYHRDVSMRTMRLEDQSLIVFCTANDPPYVDEIRVPAEQLMHRKNDVRRLILKMGGGFDPEVVSFVKATTGLTPTEIIEEERNKGERKKEEELRKSFSLPVNVVDIPIPKKLLRIEEDGEALNGVVAFDHGNSVVGKVPLDVLGLALVRGYVEEMKTARCPFPKGAVQWLAKTLSMNEEDFCSTPRPERYDPYPHPAVYRLHKKKRNA